MRGGRQYSGRAREKAPGREVAVGCWPLARRHRGEVSGWRRIYHGCERGKKQIAGFHCTGGTRELQDSDCGSGEAVAGDRVAVALDEDAGIVAVADVVAGGGIAVADQGDAVERDGMENRAGADDGIIGRNENADLIGAEDVVLHVDAIGLIDRDAGGVRGTVRGRVARRIDIIRDGVTGDCALCAKTDLDAILCGTDGGADAGHGIFVDGHLRAGLVRGDSVLLIPVHCVAGDGDAGVTAGTAFDFNGVAALAAVEAADQTHVAYPVVGDDAGSVLVENADEPGGTVCDAVRGAVHDETFELHIGGILRDDDGRDGIARGPGGVRGNSDGLDDNAVVRFKNQFGLYQHLFVIGAGADADDVPGFRGVHGGLNRGESCRWAARFVFGNDDVGSGVGGDGLCRCGASVERQN
jgi:hypothetical protein